MLGSSELGGEHIDDQSRDELLGLMETWLSRARNALQNDESARYEALRAQVNRIDPAVVHHRDLDRVRAHGWDRPVRIAVLHHPLSPLPIAPEIAHMGGLLNAGAIKNALFEAGVDLVLHGHQHSGWIGEERWPELYRDRTLYISAAPSLGSTEVGESRGFNEIRIVREGTRRYRVTVQRFVEQAGSWAAAGSPVTFTPGQGRV